MPSHEGNGSKRSAPTRFVVWVLAFVFYGRLRYNNSLYDVRQLTVAHVVVRLLCIGITLSFVYYNLFVLFRRAPRIAGYIWAMVAIGVVALFGWKTIIEAGVDSAEIADPLDRKEHHTADDQRVATRDRTKYLHRKGSVLDGTPNDD